MGHKDMKISVLGTEYTIVWVVHDPAMGEVGGTCDRVTKTIKLVDMSTVPEWCDESEEVRSAQEKACLRHELIHAYLNESGLQWNSCSTDAWATNEEMVDWFAIQFPKIHKSFEETGCL